MGSWYRLLESSGKCDRKEELRRSMKRCPQSQLCSDANVPAVGAKGQDTGRVRQAGSMARPHGNLRPCWLVPPVLSELPINTAGDGGNGASKQPFGQESKRTAWLHHRCRWAVVLPRAASQFCSSLSVLLGIQSPWVPPDRTVAPGDKQASETPGPQVQLRWLLKYVTETTTPSTC